MLTLGLVIKRTATTKPVKFQAKIGSIAPQSIAKVLVGDVVVKVNGVTVASDDGTLLHGGTIHHVVTAIKQSPKGQILEMDVLREYSSGRSTSATMASVTYGNSNDQIHASTNRHNDGRRLSSNSVAGSRPQDSTTAIDEIAN
jgi:C-terminal processing protease CtpA/Prc